MANVLSIDEQVAIISALAEGSGIRQVERITGVHRDTIMRLGMRVAQDCVGLLDRRMRNLTCEHLQFDEIWGFIGKKERHCMADDDPQIGDAWTFCAIDSDTKLVPSFKVGNRDSLTHVFSKMRENFEAAVALHFAYYNFVKQHDILRTTPVVAAGIERDFWTVSNLLEAVA